MKIIIAILIFLTIGELILFNKTNGHEYWMAWIEEELFKKQGARNENKNG